VTKDVSVTELMSLVGCTYRQIDHWVRMGYVHAIGDAEPGSGNPRRFTPKDVFMARIVKTLQGFGFSGLPLGDAMLNIRSHFQAARLVYIQADGTTHWGPGDTAAIVIDLDQLRLKSDAQTADNR
jgi:hypothetical protein